MISCELYRVHQSEHGQDPPPDLAAAGLTGTLAVPQPTCVWSKGERPSVLVIARAGARGRLPAGSRVPAHHPGGDHTTDVSIAVKGPGAMHEPRLHPSARMPVPDSVGDILLWRLAVDVAAAHRPGPDGRCTSLLCTDQPRYPCPPATGAQRAAVTAQCRTPIARGRATVPTTGTGRAALIGAAAAVTHQGAAPYQSDLWPPPLRRPTAGRAA